MKLASLRHGRDGRLVVVSRDLKMCVAVPGVAPTLQSALDGWAEIAPQLKEVYDLLNSGNHADGAHPFDPKNCLSPLPRAYQWADGSAYVTHVELVRKARGAEMPPSFWTDPLMYQGGSDSFIGPTDPIVAGDEAWGIDFEAEVAVVTDDVPYGTTADNAGKHIKLVMLVNDVSLRNLIPNELAKNFGFFQSKPASAFSPVAVTPDELGGRWRDNKLHLPLRVWLNGESFGEPDAGIDMTFSFAQLIAHAAKTRALVAGSIVGSGTVSNKSGNVGSCCIAERRTLETIESGTPTTPFMKFGDRVTIEMLDTHGHSIFGAIDQHVVKPDFALYGYFRSSAAFRARIALNLKGIEPELRFIHLLRNGGEQHTTDYKSINPQELIPALAHDGHLITQSMAIIEYLDEIVPQPPLLPKSAYERARVRELSYVVGCEIHPVNNLRVGQYLMSRYKLSADDAAGWRRHWIRTGFDALETMLSGSPLTGAYCHGDAPTMADVLLVPQCANARREKMELDPWPTIARIEAHALTHPAFEAALPKNQPDAE